MGRVGKKIKSIKEHASAMWFFQSKGMAIVSTCTVFLFLIANCVIFAQHYDYWIRSYQFVLSGTYIGALILIILYWNRTDADSHGPEEDAHKLLTAPMIAMTVFMAVGSVLGYLQIFYYTTVFTGCDRAVEAESIWQLAADYFFYITIMLIFVVYPAFILRCYWVPMCYHWRWINFFITGTLVVLFCHISFEEAFETYVHLCDNAFVLKHHWCPTVIERHHYECTGENFTEVQDLWINMHEQVIGPGIFLLVSEYIPLLFVLIWMAPVEDATGIAHSSMRQFQHDDTMSVASGELDRLHDDSGRTVMGVQEKKNQGSLTPSKTVCIVLAVTGSLTFFLTLVRLGLQLNHVGRHPRSELILEAVGHMLSACGECFFYGVGFFLWLHRWTAKLIKGHSKDEHIQHHLIHAKFDTFLLRTATAIFSIQIIVTAVSEADFTRWTGPFYIAHRIPVLASIWLQYLTVSKALMLDAPHWKVAGRRQAFVFAIVAITANFFEWIAQFVKRRFMVYLLDTGEQLSPVVVSAIAISEILYPALSFYYFHALLCWIVIFWRVLTMDESNHLPKEIELTDKFSRKDYLQDELDLNDSQTAKGDISYASTSV